MTSADRSAPGDPQRTRADSSVPSLPSEPGTEETASRNSREANKGISKQAPPPTTDASFPRTHRLSLDLDYQSVFRNGRRFTGPRLILHFLPNDQGHHRLGLSVGRWFGPAVVRTRFKRLVREWYRLSGKNFAGATGLDLIVHPQKPKTKGKKKGALFHRLPWKYAELRAELNGLMEDACRGPRGRGPSRPPSRHPSGRSPASPRDPQKDLKRDA